MTFIVKNDFTGRKKEKQEKNAVFRKKSLKTAKLLAFKLFETGV